MLRWNMEAPARTVGAFRFMNTVELRKAQRAETLKAGLILLKNGGGGIRCMIRNMSPFGACLQVVNHFGVPLDIILVIAGEHFKRPCRIVWRGSNQLGVIFS